MLEQKPAMIVMADVGTMPAAGARKIRSTWLKEGGTLVRFAGSRLAAAGNDRGPAAGAAAGSASARWADPCRGRQPQPVSRLPPTPARLPTCRRPTR
jgi:hypothetical protein